MCAVTNDKFGLLTGQTVTYMASKRVCLDVKQFKKNLFQVLSVYATPFELVFRVFSHSRMKLLWSAKFDHSFLVF